MIERRPCRWIADRLLCGIADRLASAELECRNMDVRAQRISLWITPFFGAILFLALAAEALI